VFALALRLRSDAVVMVADEVFAVRERGRAAMRLGFVYLPCRAELARILCVRFAPLFRNEMIVVSLPDQARLSRSGCRAGSDAFVTKRALATDLLASADSVSCRPRFVSPVV